MRIVRYLVRRYLQRQEADRWIWLLSRYLPRRRHRHSPQSLFILAQRRCLRVRFYRPRRSVQRACRVPTLSRARRMQFRTVAFQRLSSLPAWRTGGRRPVRVLGQIPCASRSPGITLALLTRFSSGLPANGALTRTLCARRPWTSRTGGNWRLAIIRTIGASVLRVPGMGEGVTRV